jgi:hypothetical protein
MNRSNLNQSSQPLSKFTKMQMESIITQYDNSSYFHVGPRRQLFDVLSKLFMSDINYKITSREDVIISKNIMSKYYKSNYFHVGQRRYIFERIEAYF